MARRRANSAKIDPALFHRSASSVTLTEGVITAYLSILRAEGRAESSLHLCETVLRQFLAFLPDGVLAKDSLSVWREQLLAEGFAIRTVNCRVSTVSALLEAMDCREFQVDRQLRPPGAAGKNFIPPILPQLLQYPGFCHFFHPISLGCLGFPPYSPGFLFHCIKFSPPPSLVQFIGHNFSYTHFAKFIQRICKI